jgi:hypothetical protein
MVVAARFEVVLIASMWMTLAAPVGANDLFIGTLSIEGERVVLRRCDLAQNTYRLRDADGAFALDSIRKREPAAKGYWYGEVIGEYVAIDGGDGLSVTSIENIEADKNCHLSDLIDIDDGSPASQLDNDRGS